MPLLMGHGVTSDNRLLAALPREEYERLSPHLESVRLVSGKILYNAGEAVRHAYFPKGGMVSLLSVTEAGRSIEVGMIGSEGMAGIPIVLRSALSPYQVMVQLASDALRIKAAALRAEFNLGGRLQDLLLRYTHSLLVQVAQSAACNRFHTVQERLCRWLLVSRDRVQSDTLQLTQEFISHMLGVPRTSVTMIAGDLQREGLIRCGRGRIIILDRALLKAGSCECYERVREGVDQSLTA